MKIIQLLLRFSLFFEANFLTIHYETTKKEGTKGKITSKEMWKEKKRIIKNNKNIKIIMKKEK